MVVAGTKAVEAPMTCSEVLSSLMHATSATMQVEQVILRVR